MGRMTSFLISLLGVVTATNQVLAASQFVADKTGIRVPVKVERPASADPVEREYQKLLDMDNEAQSEVDDWIQKESAFAEKGASLANVTLNARIEQRFAPVKKGYKEFLERHPEHVKARLAYGSFLNDIGEESEGVAQWEKALVLDPKNPATYNNLATYYGHNGPAKKAFEYFEKTIELSPKEPLYYHNFGMLVYQYRQEAKAYFKCEEQQVFDKALGLYQKALDLSPKDFPLATDLAQTYYLIKPFRTDDAIKAWDYALTIARDDIEREGIQIHLARVKMNVGRYTEARQHLGLVTNAMYNGLKERLYKNLDEKQDKTTKQIGPAL